MFSWISRRLQRKLDYIDPRKKGCGPVLMPVPSTERWYYFEQLQNKRAVRSEHFVLDIVWYKQRAEGHPTEHEYLILTTSSPIKPILLLEREHIAESSVNSPSAAASDIVISLRANELSKYTKSRKASIVATYTPTDSKLTLFELSRALRLISRSAPNYVLNATDSYWFARTVIGVVVEPHHFKECPGKAFDQRGTCAGLRQTHHPPNVDDIREKLLKEVTDNPNPMGHEEAQEELEAQELRHASELSAYNAQLLELEEKVKRLKLKLKAQLAHGQNHNEPGPSSVETSTQ